MADDTTAEQLDEQEAGDENQRRGRGPAKAFPILPLEEALQLSNWIAEHGLSDQIRRTTLFEKVERSPDSGQSRALITASGRYGLTDGSYKAQTLKLLGPGKVLADSSTSQRDEQNGVQHGGRGVRAVQRALRPPQGQEAPCR